MNDRTHDPGAQNERTSLAWTRTGLAVLVAVLLATRLAADRLGAIVVAFAVITVPAAVVILLAAGRRYRHSHRALHEGRVLPDGRLPGMVALVVVLLALIELGYALAP